MRLKTCCVIVAGVLLSLPARAGKTMKWEEVPQAVRDAVLAHGGTAGPVDLESEKRDGKAVYEAAV